jgi:nucleotide-binding universal stress UspA family protein
MFATRLAAQARTPQERLISMSHDARGFDLVAGIDYSDVSDAVLETALDIARHRRAHLHVISIAGGYGPPRLPDDLADEAKHSFREQALRTLESFVAERSARLEQQGNGVDRSSLSVFVDFGNPEERILALAQKVQADLIVVGTHGKRGVDRLVLGSVAESVLRHAHCSVAVVRAPRA